MILARLVSPREMGIIALTGLFFAIANSLKDAGIGSALIRKQDRTNTDICTVFWFNCCSNFFIAFVLFLLAPIFADFFKEDALTWLTRCSAFLLFLSSFSSIHLSLFEANRDFKQIAIIQVISTLGAMPVTLYTAYIGWSYWALMMQSLISSLLTLILSWCLSNWRPSLIFSYSSFKEFFSYGINLALSGVVWSLYNESVNFIIGKFYSPARLATYSRAYMLGNLPGTTIFEPLSSMMFPILSTIQHDISQLNSVYRKYAKLVTIPMVWIMSILTFNSESIIMLLYGESWLESAQFLPILCLGFIFSPIIRANHSLIKVIGRTDLLLKRELIIRTCGIIIMCIAACHSVITICYGFLIFSILNCLVTIYYTKKVSGISMKNQLLDLAPYVVLSSIVTGITSYIFSNIVFYYQVFIVCLISFTLYNSILYFLKDEAYMIFTHEIKKRYFNINPTNK